MAPATAPASSANACARPPVTDPGTNAPDPWTCLGYCACGQGGSSATERGLGVATHARVVVSHYVTVLFACLARADGQTGGGSYADPLHDEMTRPVSPQGGSLAPTMHRERGRRWFWAVREVALPAALDCGFQPETLCRTCTAQEPWWSSAACGVRPSDIRQTSAGLSLETIRQGSADVLTSRRGLTRSRGGHMPPAPEDRLCCGRA